MIINEHKRTNDQTWCIVQQRLQCREMSALFKNVFQCARGLALQVFRCVGVVGDLQQHGENVCFGYQSESMK